MLIVQYNVRTFMGAVGKVKYFSQHIRDRILLQYEVDTERRAFIAGVFPDLDLELCMDEVVQEKFDNLEREWKKLVVKKPSLPRPDKELIEVLEIEIQPRRLDTTDFEELALVMLLQLKITYRTELLELRDLRRNSIYQPIMSLVPAQSYAKNALKLYRAMRRTGEVQREKLKQELALIAPEL